MVRRFRNVTRNAAVFPLKQMRRSKRTVCAYLLDAEIWYQPIAYRWALNLRKYDAAEPKRLWATTKRGVRVGHYPGAGRRKNQAGLTRICAARTRLAAAASESGVGCGLGGLVSWHDSGPGRSLVQEQPVESQFLRRFCELKKVHRLADIAVCAQPVPT